MPISRAYVYSKVDTVSWLQDNAVPNIFSSISYSDNVITCYDSDNKAVFRWNLGSGTSGNAYLYRVPNDLTSAISVANVPFYENIGEPIYLFKCDGGVFITQYYTSSGYSYILNIIFTKTNQLKHATILNTSLNGSSASWNSNIYPVAVGDRSGAISSFSFSTSSQLQTQFVPFMTYTQGDSISYTPCAFYLPAGEYYNIRKGIFTSQTGTYVTNGYIALKDAVVTSD